MKKSNGFIDVKQFHLIQRGYNEILSTNTEFHPTNPLGAKLFDSLAEPIACLYAQSCHIISLKLHLNMELT